MRISDVFRGALIVFIGVFSIWPFYIDVRLHENIGINPQRLVLVLTALFFILVLTTTKGFIRTIGSAWWRNPDGRAIFFALSAYTVLRLVSSVIAGPYSIFIFSNELIANAFVMLIAGAVYRDYADARRFVLFLIALGVIVSFYAILERITQQNFLVSFADVNTRAGFTAATEKIRNGVYRSQATFEHPLSLVQYLAMIIPLLYLLIRRFGALVVFPFTVIGSALYFTGSRSAVIAIFLSIVAMIAIAIHAGLRERSGRTKKGTLLTALFLLYGVLLIGGATLINDAVSGDSESHTASTTTRVAQINNGLLAIARRPIFGYGPGEASRIIMHVGETESGADTIYRETTDNLFLTRAVESGVPSLIALLYLIYKVLKLAIQSSISNPDRKVRVLNIALFGSLLSGVTLMSVLSIFTVLPIFFILMGILVGVNANLSSRANLSFSRSQT